MNCHSVQRSLSAFLDGWLTEAERRPMLQHLARCPDCALVFARMQRIRAALKTLPVRPAPPELTSILRVMASHYRAGRMYGTSPAAVFSYLADRARLFADNLMRPLALPFAGGVLSAIVLFSMFVPSIVFRRSYVNDVPIASLSQEASVRSFAPFGFKEADFVLEVTVDPRGRMVGYSLRDGVMEDQELRRSIENNLLFTGFYPATTFGQPRSGKIVVSFSRKQIDIGS